MYYNIFKEAEKSYIYLNMMNTKNFIDILEVEKMDRREKQMVINYDNLKEIYGEEIIETLNDNMDIVEKNIKTMKELGFEDVEGIFERNVETFLYFPQSFKEKINNLIEKLGPDYVNIIENDVSYLENL